MNSEDIIIKNQQGLERCIMAKTNDLSNQIKELKEQQNVIIDYLENIYRSLNNN